MLHVALLQVVELLLAGLVGQPGCFRKEVTELIRSLEDVEGHLEGGVLELDDEVDKELVLVLSDRELLPDAPKLLGYPVCQYGHVFEVVDEGSDVGYLVIEAAGEPELPPRGSFLILVNQRETDDLGDSGVSVGVYLDLPILC